MKLRRSASSGLKAEITEPTAERSQRPACAVWRARGIARCCLLTAVPAALRQTAAVGPEAAITKNCRLAVNLATD